MKDDTLDFLWKLTVCFAVILLGLVTGTFLYELSKASKEECVEHLNRAQNYEEYYMTKRDVADCWGVIGEIPENAVY